MGIEIVFQFLAFIWKLVANIATAIYYFFIATIPQLFAFLLEMIRRTISWFVPQYVKTKAELRLARSKKLNKLVSGRKPGH